MNWNVDLTGETALVIGGTKNIGLAVAQALQSAGAAIAVVGGSDQAALDTALELPDSGTYVFRLMADDGDLTSQADVTIEAPPFFNACSMGRRRGWIPRRGSSSSVCCDRSETKGRPS